MATPPMDPALIDEAHALVEQHGNIAAAARAAGIPYTTLERRYKSAKVDPAIKIFPASAMRNSPRRPAGICDLLTLSAALN